MIYTASLIICHDCFFINSADIEIIRLISCTPPPPSFAPQFPAALHFCFTAAHTEATADALLADMAQCCERLRADPSCVASSTAPIYGKTVRTLSRGG